MFTINKKLWKTVFFGPVLVLPVFTIVACKEIQQPQGDQIKAIANVKNFFSELKPYFQAWLPSEVHLEPFVGKGVTLPKLDPRQNFGYLTTYSAIDQGDDDQAGLKKFKLTISRGQEVYEEIIVINGFLRLIDQINEKDKILNPEERFKEFSRHTDFVIRVSLDEADRILINDFLEQKSPLDLAKKYERKILRSWSYVDEELAVPQIEITNLRAATQYGIPTEFVFADLKLISGQGFKRKTSGTYTLRFEGFDAQANNLYTKPILQKYIQLFGTLNTPMKKPDDSNYATRKASELNPDDLQDLLEQEFDNDRLTKGMLQATLVTFGQPNDLEGSIQAVFDFSFRNLNGPDDPKIEYQPVKIYGFKIAKK